MSKFADLTKAVEALLEKPFCYDRKVELKTKAADGATMTAEAKVGEKGADAKAVFTGTLFGVADKITLGSDKKVSAEFTLSNAAPKTDLSLTLTDATRTAKPDCAAVVGATYKHADLGTYTVDADVASGPVFSFSGLFKRSGFFLGGAGKVGSALLSEDKRVKSGEFADVAAAVGFEASDYTSYLLGKWKTDKGEKDGVSLVVTHKASSSLEAALSACMPCDKSKSWGVTFGGAYKLDDSTTLHSTVDSSAKVAFAYKQKLCPMATLTVSALVDVPNIASDDQHKFGLLLNLTN